MAVGNKAEGGRDGENQACKRPGRARDGDRGNTEAIREGGDPELDLGIRRNHEDIEATRCKTPVTTKEEENPGRGGDTKEDEGSREEEEARYQSDQVPQDRLEEFLSALTWDSEDGGMACMEVDDARYLQLIGDGTRHMFQVGATDNAKYHELVQSWDSENGGNEVNDSRYLELAGYYELAGDQDGATIPSEKV